jgi:hypothetical protein
MKFSASVLISLGLYNAAFAYQMFIRIPSSQSGPCPGLNTLANHGYIPAQGIARDPLVEALTGVYNLDSTLAGSLADGVESLYGVEDANGDTVFNLADMRNHNLTEHDASLTRSDFGDVSHDNWSPQPDLIQQMVSLSQDGESLTWCDLVKTRFLRIEQESASDPSFNFTAKNAEVAHLNTVVAMEVFGNGQNMSLKFFQSFFEQEMIPDEWQAPATALTWAQAFADIANMEKLESDPKCQP